jgi:hypothetical protein
MTRSPTDYLRDWDNPTQSGDSRKNASGADSDGGDYRWNIPYSQKMPETQDYGMYGPSDGGFGHSDDVKDTGTKSSAWGMSKDDQAKGYERPGSGGAKEPGTASFEQSIPQTNEWDRQEAYSRAHNDTGVHDGEGHDKPSPGREAMGSSKLVG